uniref:Protein kinase domain-containing protein n=1 Tax=Acrobeloides nanus TaxID=290746 RepID=A0A914DFF1_9BILA
MARQIDISRDNTKNVTHPYYRAPEVFFSKNYDFKADVWSIGCIFAELLTGNFLFRGLDDFDQLIQIIKIVGTPDENYLLKLENSVQIIFRTLAKRVGVKWEELFPDDIFPEEKKKKFCTAENGRHLLSLMLIFDPDQRISVEKALEEPYVAWKRNSDNNDSPPKAIYDDSLENMKLTTGEWKSKFFSKFL